MAKSKLKKPGYANIFNLGCSPAPGKSLATQAAIDFADGADNKERSPAPDFFNTFAPMSNL